ncbi:hypothetical protein G8759_27590 [Spirosoma aureum]|uniref:Uncharacterized protein n=1 Tax=Spirosoma aureum TaxID=2692134 RepID=A0A6G9AUX5_9BACT|nr:DUF6660 family protein [Spirosoma aureum]QIP16129.1 hypothetical protein G8759_27590 [Spirosoma aureum]
MKLVVYLFSFWLLLLAGLPCPDADCHAHERIASTTEVPHPADDHDHGHKAPCSPFCHCATCAGFSIPRIFSYSLSVKLTTLFPIRQFFAYQSPNHADVIQSVWQPPKL